MTAVDLSPSQARAVLRMVVLGLQAHVRNGGALPPGIREACETLAATADAPIPPAVSTACGTAPGTVVTSSAGQVTAPVAASLVGVSESYARRLARSGRVRATRAGRDWLVDVDSLRAVLRRTA